MGSLSRKQTETQQKLNLTFTQKICNIKICPYNSANVERKLINPLTRLLLHEGVDMNPRSSAPSIKHDSIEHVAGIGTMISRGQNSFNAFPKMQSTAHITLGL